MSEDLELDPSEESVEELISRAVYEALRDALEEIDLVDVLYDGARAGAVEALEGTAMMLSIKKKSKN